WGILTEKVVGYRLSVVGWPVVSAQSSAVSGTCSFFLLRKAFYIYHDKRKIAPFWRDHQQREVDFVVPRGRDAVDAYECKWSGLKPDLHNLQAFRQVYPHGKNFVVVPQTSAGQALRLEGLDVEIISPTDLMPED